MDKITSSIFTKHSKKEFDELVMETYNYQFQHNEVYHQYVSLLKRQINTISDIPFLPISFFKSHRVTCFPEKQMPVFKSSGTTGEIASQHFIYDFEIYKESFLKGFEKTYGNVREYCILALLPSYMERKDSSLVYMVKELIEQTCHSDSGFFLHNYNDLADLLKKHIHTDQKVILLGVSFALIDFSEAFPMELSNNVIIIETGGMKGRRKEITRNELHGILSEKFGKKIIHSEYGMTELFSQAYSLKNGLFECPPWMKIMIRDVYDPYTYLENGKTGGINVIDLANRYSCSFIETQDLGRLNKNGLFEVLGRIEDSPIRGCNLMVD